MSFITFQCYACGQMLKVGGDKGGRKAKCHKCGTILTIPVASVAPPPPSSPRAAPPPLPPARTAPPTDHVVPPAAVVPTPVAPTPVAPFADREEEPPRPRRRRDRDEYEDEEAPRVQRPADLWWRAKLGLLLVFIGACVLAGAFALELIAYLLLSINLVRALVGSAPSGPGSGNAFAILLRISLFIDLAASVTAGVGYVFCILGPRQRGGLGLAIAVTAVAGLRFLLVLIFKLPPFLGPLVQMGPGAGLGLGIFMFWFMLLLIQLLFAAELVLFAFYMRSLSLLQKDKWNANGSTFVAMLGCVYGGERLLTFIFFYLVLNAFPREPSKAMVWITLILLWIGAFLFGGLIGMYILRIWRTRDLI
jgi:hypothetical protein